MNNKITFLVLAMMFISLTFVAADVNKINFGRNESNPSQMIPFLLSAEGKQKIDINLVNITTGSISLNGTQIFDWGDIVSSPNFPSFLLANGSTPLTGLWNFGSFGINGSGDILTTGNTSSNNTYISNILRSNKGNFEHNFEIISGSNWTASDDCEVTIQINIVEDIIPVPIPEFFNDENRTGYYVVVTSGNLSGEFLDIKTSSDIPFADDKFLLADNNNCEGLLSGDTGYVVFVNQTGDVLIDGELNVTQTMYGRDLVLSNSLSWNGEIDNNLTFLSSQFSGRDYGLIMGGNGLFGQNGSSFTGGYIEFATGANSNSRKVSYLTMNGLDEIYIQKTLRDNKTGGLENGVWSVNINTGASRMANGSFVVDEDGNVNATGNITIGDKITFAFGEMIDNIVDGWIRITGSLDVTEDLNVTGNTTSSFFIGDGSFLTGIVAGDVFNNTDGGYNFSMDSSFDWTTTGNLSVNFINSIKTNVTSDGNISVFVNGENGIKRSTMTWDLGDNDFVISEICPSDLVWWAEESSSLSTATAGGLQFSWGNGNIGGFGPDQICSGRVYAMSIDCEISASTVGKVQIAINGVAQGASCQVSSPGTNTGTSTDLSCALEFNQGDQLAPITTTSDATTNGCTVQFYTRFNGN